MSLSPRTLWLPATLLGLGATLALFWLMAWMTAGGNLELPETRATRLVEFVRLKPHPKPPPPTRRQPPKPPAKEPPPPKPVLTTPRPVATVSPNIEIPALDIPLSQRLRGSLLAGIGAAPATAPSSQVIPLVRIPPRYPMRARMRRIEGWVKLEFTITPQGTVKDIRVVEAYPKGVFERAAVEAIARWKFKPLVIDGRPVEQRAVQLLEFKLRR